MSEWKTIKTAPRNAPVILYGTLLTYCCNSADHGKPFGDPVVAQGSYHIDRWRVGNYECIPTHWMPLPEPPKEKSK